MQAFSTADDLFADVAETAQGDTRWQALLGQAQIVHYQMPGRDPEEAIPLYKALLAEVGDKAEWRGQVLARLADCHAEVVPVQIDKARELYREALVTLPATSLMVQETALRFPAQPRNPQCRHAPPQHPGHDNAGRYPACSCPHAPRPRQ